jgi:hypothetical protein
MLISFEFIELSMFFFFLFDLLIFFYFFLAVGLSGISTFKTTIFAQF